MKPIYVCCPQIRGMGGIATYTQSILHALEPVAVDALGQGKDTSLYSLPSHVRYLGSPTKQWQFAARLARDWMFRPPSVFLFSHVGLLRPLGLLPRRPQHRVILLAHGMEVWDTLPRLRAMGLSRVNEVVCTTHYTKKLFWEHNKNAFQPNVKFEIIPLSVTPMLEALPLARVPTGKKRTVLVISRLTKGEPLKGISTLLRAAQRLDDSSWRIRVVGEGDAREHYRQESERLGVSRLVEFLGWKSEDEKRHEIEACDVVCLPSAQEGFGIIFLEAMVAGKPCVGAAAGAIPEVLPLGVSRLHPFDDDAALAEALVEIVEAYRLGKIQPAHIREAYDTRYSWKQFAARWKQQMSEN